MKYLRTRHGRNGQHSSNTPFAVGVRIRAVANFGRHSYQAGKIYTVVDVDPNDNTLRARDSSGEEGNWIRWADCRAAEDIGWDWLKGALPAEALDLLSNFDGLDGLRLREEVRTALLLKIPNLKNAILEAQEQMQMESLEKTADTDVDEDEEDMEHWGL